MTGAFYCTVMFLTSTLPPGHQPETPPRLSLLSPQRPPSACLPAQPVPSASPVPEIKCSPASPTNHVSLRENPDPRLDSRKEHELSGKGYMDLPMIYRTGPVRFRRLDDSSTPTHPAQTSDVIR